MVSPKNQLQGSLSRPQTMVAPNFLTNPWASTAGRTPSSSRIGMLAGSRDSPTWSRGKRSLSSRTTRQPWRASMVAAALPAGPPPMTTTSAFIIPFVAIDYRNRRATDPATAELPLPVPAPGQGPGRVPTRLAGGKSPTPETVLRPHPAAPRIPES